MHHSNVRHLRYGNNCDIAESYVFEWAPFFLTPLTAFNYPLNVYTWKFFQLGCKTCIFSNFSHLCTIWIDCAKLDRQIAQGRIKMAPAVRKIKSRMRIVEMRRVYVAMGNTRIIKSTIVDNTMSGKMYCTWVNPRQRECLPFRKPAVIRAHVCDLHVLL